MRKLCFVYNNKTGYRRIDAIIFGHFVTAKPLDVSRESFRRGNDKHSDSFLWLEWTRSETSCVIYYEWVIFKVTATGRGKKHSVRVSNVIPNNQQKFRMSDRTYPWHPRNDTTENSSNNTVWHETEAALQNDLLSSRNHPLKVQLERQMSRSVQADKNWWSCWAPAVISLSRSS